MCLSGLFQRLIIIGPTNEEFCDRSAFNLREEKQAGKV
jgi:hypothetical protein